MLDTTKRTLATLTAATFLGAGGWAVAQSTSTTPNTQSQGSTAQAPGYGSAHQGPRAMGETVSADVLAKITTAVQAKLAGSTVERAMKAPDGTYHAHVVQKDGTEVHVTLSSAFAVTSVGQGMRGGPGGRDHGPIGTATTAAELAKVTSAVVAKLPGSKVERAMKAPDGTYHAHVIKQDGTDVFVTLSSAFAVTAVDTLMGPGRGGPGGRHGQETPLTGETAAKVKAAALAKLPGATVDRLENDSDGGKYEAHVTKADGTRATVQVDASFTVTAVENR